MCAIVSCDFCRISGYPGQRSDLCLGYTIHHMGDWERARASPPDRADTHVAAACIMQQLHLLKDR